MENGDCWPEIIHGISYVCFMISASLGEAINLEHLRCCRLRELDQLMYFNTRGREMSGEEAEGALLEPPRSTQCAA